MQSRADTMKTRSSDLLVLLALLLLVDMLNLYGRLEGFRVFGPH